LATVRQLSATSSRPSPVVVRVAGVTPVRRAVAVLLPAVADLRAVVGLVADAVAVDVARLGMDDGRGARLYHSGRDGDPERDDDEHHEDRQRGTCAMVDVPPRHDAAPV
jgi:hypothetical protein